MSALHLFALEGRGDSAKRCRVLVVTLVRRLQPQLVQPRVGHTKSGDEDAVELLHDRLGALFLVHRQLLPRRVRLDAHADIVVQLSIGPCKPQTVAIEQV